MYFLYRHSLIYAVNLGTHEKKHGRQKPCKSRLLNKVTFNSSTKGEENRIELQTTINKRMLEIETLEIEECL